MAADQNPTPWTMIAPREAVEESSGSAYWSVARCRRGEVPPDLPDDLVALFAPAVAVSTARVR